MNQAFVRIIIGSTSDEEKLAPALDVLAQFGVGYDFYVSSAHRDPERTVKLATNAAAEGIRVIIAAAGMAAHLPGVIAAHTTLPVIGIPIASGALNGVDALYSIVQMPPGVPVACVGINGAKNAALLAVQILALQDQELAAKFYAYKEGMKS
ncbi:MAG: 5-(carboxyamino)imidazole ribonucleotide mutase [Candidatus Cloacimonetes bacterium]|nr:5-(carboxyamino)imidazole ribonucleotide mutase [Candidatus Cloacimonadota bacterium]